MVSAGRCGALSGRPPTTQKGWLKTLRHLISFAIAEGDCQTDPTIGIKTTKPAKSSGYLTWSDVQIERYRERHKIGTMARLALELREETSRLSDGLVHRKGDESPQGEIACLVDNAVTFPR